MKIQFACFVVISPMLILASMAAPNFDLTAQQTQEVVGVNSAPSLRMAANGDDSMAVIADRVADKDLRDMHIYRTAGCTDDYAFTYIAAEREIVITNHAKVAPNPKKKVCGWWFWTDPHNKLSVYCRSASLRDVDYMVIYDINTDTHYGWTDAEITYTGFFDLSTDVAVGFESEVGKEEKSFDCTVSAVAMYMWYDVGDDSRQIFFLTLDTIYNYTEAKAFAEDINLSLYWTIDRDVYDVHAFIDDLNSATESVRTYTIFLDAYYHLEKDEWRWPDDSILEFNRTVSPDPLDASTLSDPRLQIVDGSLSVVEASTGAMRSGYRDMNTYADPTTKKR